LRWANQIPQKKVGLVKGIAQAKNGGELFSEEKFHAANGKAQPHTQAALHFFLLIGWGVGGGGLEQDSFQFSLVPTMFPSSSHQLLNMFAKFSMYSPTCSP
jgi:hypothetical protein